MQKEFLRYPGVCLTIEQVINLKVRAENMEEDFHKWETSLPPEWQGKAVAWFDDIPQPQTVAWFNELPQTFRTVEMQKPFPGKIDIYSDLWTAATGTHLGLPDF